MQIQYRTEIGTVFESALFRTTTCVFDLSSAVLLVDPNWLPREITFIRQHVIDILKGRPLYLLFTHSDYDHIIAYSAFPEAQVIATQAFQDNPDSEKQIEAILQFDHDNYIERSYPIVYPKVDILIKEDGQELLIGEESLSFLLAPGHTADGMITYLNSKGVLVAGDYLSNIEFPYVYQSVAAYRDTLAKAKQFIETNEVKLLITGHGDVTDDRHEMQRRVRESEQYLDQLEDSVKKEIPFPDEALWKRYQFRRGMQKFHDANLDLMKKELHVD